MKRRSSRGFARAFSDSGSGISRVKFTHREARRDIPRDVAHGPLHNLRVTPTPIEDNELRLDLTYEEAKARELGFTVGFG
jgi:hypothetical protein